MPGSITSRKKHKESFVRLCCPFSSEKKKKKKTGRGIQAHTPVHTHNQSNQRHRPPLIWLVSQVLKKKG